MRSRIEKEKHLRWIPTIKLSGVAFVPSRVEGNQIGRARNHSELSTCYGGTFPQNGTITRNVFACFFVTVDEFRVLLSHMVRSEATYYLCNNIKEDVC
jgi:hypothetical protein